MLRRHLLTPNVAETTLAKRGFHKKSRAAQERLETIGRTFLDGYGAAMSAREPAEAADEMDRLPGWLHGFAYEGAGMGFAVLDGLPLGRSDHLRRFLDEPRAQTYSYLIHVGVGWGMARMPRFRWPKPESLDPMLVPLVLDGYGFHQAYFKTGLYVTEQFRDPRFPWPGGEHGWYAGNSIDQGIGRAAWFIGGTDPERVADMLDAFPEERRGDLYSGTGLAAAYAGGVEESELLTLLRRAGEHRGQLAQGAAFATDARVRAGVVPPHTELAAKVLCGLTPDDAARLTTELRPADGEAVDVPAYELWRQRTAARLVSGGVNT
jgi:enediyne biosynthesis protein E3